MDRYSYNPNSRISRRIKERERKRKKRKKIISISVVCVIFVGVVFGAYKISGIELPVFDPVGGFKRLGAFIVQNSSEEESQSPDAKEQEAGDEAGEQTNAAQTPQPTEAVINTPAPSEGISEQTQEKSAAGIYPPTSENNNLLDIFKNAQGEEEKVCCLTFDDGPNSATTPKILDVLAEYEIKATFFEVGNNLKNYPDLAKRTYDEGHLLANHTYTQKYSTIYSNWDSFWGEIEQTEKLISEITGKEPFKLVRFPGGSFNSGVYASVKQDFKTKLAENGYYYIDWSVDSGDDGTRNASQVLEYVKDYCGSKPVVLLFEDSPSRNASIQALDDIIEYLQKRGYVFKRLDEINYYTPDQVVLTTPEPEKLSGYEIFRSRGYIF